MISDVMTMATGIATVTASRRLLPETVERGARTRRQPWPDAVMAPLPPLRTPITGKPRLDVGETLRGKHILFVGTTGFVGKVALSMLLHRYPDVGACSASCARAPATPPTSGSSRRSRRRRGVRSDPRAPRRRLRRVLAREDRAARRRHRPAAAATSPKRSAPSDRQARRDHQLRRAWCRSSRRSRARCASTSLGREERARPRAQAGAKLVHVSTCFVAGKRDGEVWEDEPVVGYFPRSRRSRATGAATNDAARSRLRSRGGDRRLPAASSSRRARARTTAQHISEFRDKGAETLARRRAATPTTSDDSRSPSQRERKMWLERRAHQARHGARAALGLDQHVHVYEVARRPDHPVGSHASRRRSCARRSSSRACAIRSRAGTRASTRPRR